MDKFSILFCVFLISLTNLHGSNSQAINEGIIGIIEDFRQQMPCGFNDSGIPILAPLLIDLLELDIEADGIRAVGILQNVRIDDLDTFLIEHINFSLLTLTLQFDFLWEEIRATGIYDLLGHAMDSFPFFGSGNFHAHPQNLRVSGSTRLSIMGGYLNMTNFLAKVELEGLNSRFEGIMGEGLTSDFVNDVLQRLVPELVTQNEEAITNLLQSIVMPYANTILNEMTLSDLIDLITGGGGEGESGETEKCIPPEQLRRFLL